MGIFGVYNNISKHGQDPIDEDFLREMGLEKTWWGSLSNKDNPQYVCWELYLESEEFNSISAYYFPADFKGYVTSLPRGANNRLIAWENSRYSNWKYVSKSPVLTKMDLITSIDEIKNLI